MRKLLPLLLLLLSWQTTQAQVPTMQEKLYYTCKVWGFVKYYHSEVSECRGQNWDSVLLHVLPLVRSAATNDEFNNALDTMLALAGPMAIATTSLPDTLPAELKRNRDFGWITSPVLRSDVQVQLDTIKNNFRPHISCWYAHNFNVTSTSYWGGYLAFPYDYLILNKNTSIDFPSIDELLYEFFKYWNIIRYFNPYNYVLDVPWDTTLLNNTLPLIYVSDAEMLYRQYLKISASLDDAHVHALTTSTPFMLPPGFFQPKIFLKYMSGNYVVARSEEIGLGKGDIIISIDGLTVTQWEDSLKQYYSAGNSAVFKRIMSYNMLGRIANGTVETITFSDSLGATQTITVSCINPLLYRTFFSHVYYPADSLKSVNWTDMPCDVAYVNMVNVGYGNVGSIYSAIRDKGTLILDLRNDCIAEVPLCSLMVSEEHHFSRFMMPDTMYPGCYYYEDYVIDNPGNPTPYSGTVILLIGSGTQSHIEFSSMLFEILPNVIKVGSQTAGADGNVTWLSASKDMKVGWTSLGIFYPNGDSTQRIGIVPDIVVEPTPAGIRQGRDEVLEKALEVACRVGVKTTAAIQSQLPLYPNPAGNVVTISVGTAADAPVAVQLTDITGRVLRNTAIATGASSAAIDVHDLAPGIYLIVAGNGVQNRTVKFVKE